ncbi:hypothetical protein GO594_30080, partial [Pseudomonas otitidis]
MAKPYPILPASVLDELHDLNCTLQAYHYLVHTAVHRLCSQDAPVDYESFLLGLQSLFQPILDGYLDIERQAKSFRESGFVGIG